MTAAYVVTFQISFFKQLSFAKARPLPSATTSLRFSIGFGSSGLN